MRKIFWDNSYQCSLDTTVLAVLGNEVLFADTIAYSFSGGQESDAATVNDMPIIDSRIEAHNIYYRLPDNHGLFVHDSVHMAIDWTRRNRLMRLHFACELILVILNRLAGHKLEGQELQPEEIDHVGIEKIGAHIAADKARIDFKLADNLSKLFPEILAAYNKVIEANLEIETGFTNKAEQRRYWRIAGLATVPCGGTHVKSTAEVGFVRLKRERPGKGIERIKITLAAP